MAIENLAERLISHPRPVIVDLWAPWCAPCRWMAPVVDRLQAEYDGRVDVWKINADEQPGVARELRVVGIPTMVAFHAGEEIVRKTGAGSEGELRAVFEAALSGEKPARPSVSALDRLLRLAAGTAVLALALSAGPSLILLVAGGAILFSAVADRCPIWQAIRPRIASAFSRRDISSG